MQQAPSYNEPEQVRREYVPQHYQAPANANVTGERQAGPLAWTDWVRWGPIWSGFFTIISTLAIVGSLGAAIALTIWGSSVPTAFEYGWAIFTGVLAYLLGGWVTSRAAGVGGVGAAMLNGGLAWALSLVAILVLVLFGLGNAVGFIGNNLYLLLHTSANGVTPADVTGTVAQTAWITFITLVVGLCLAIIGAIIGMRPLSMRRRVV